MNFFESWGKRVGLDAVVILACWCAPTVFGDGMVFPAIALPADVSFPDQSALSVWGESVERLVIKTRSAGEGANSAWAVPLPAFPAIELATTGLFPSLRYSFQPEIRHEVCSWWAVAVCALGLAWLLAAARGDASNVLLGGLIRDEDAPGNHTLQQTPGVIEILGYDTTCAGVPVAFISGTEAP